MRKVTPKELPSGRWRVQWQTGKKRSSKTFETKAEAELFAAELAAGQATAEPVGNLTVGGAIDRYIESRSAVLSPSTVLGYKRLRKSMLQEIMGVRLGVLTQDQVQRAVNTEAAAGKSPKYIRNAHGLLSAVLAAYRPSMRLNTTLPQRVKTEIRIPSSEEVRSILNAARGTPLELPIALAAWLGLRVSEICGLTFGSVEGDELWVRAALVRGENGYVSKGTKTYAGTRRLHIPPYIKALLDAAAEADAAANPGKTKGKARRRIVTMQPTDISNGFYDVCEELGLPHYRFHDLRHYNASVLLALGVPDKYAMERMGHATNNMLKTVYQHTMKDKKDEINTAIDAFFSAELPTEIPTDRRKD